MEQHLRQGARLQILYEPEQEYYMTAVVDIEKGSFSITDPVSGGKKLDMPRHSSWQFCLIGEDAVYFFTSRVTALESKDGLNIYTIKRPDSIYRQQRRGFVRVPCHLNVSYWYWEETMIKGLPAPTLATRSADLWEDPVWIRDYIGSLEERVSPKTAFTLDMSGGGVRIVTLESLKRHDRLLLKIDLSSQNFFQVMILEGKVVRSVPLNIGGWNRYRVGVSFVGLKGNAQERLISYLFKIMRKKI